MVTEAVQLVADLSQQLGTQDIELLLVANQRSKRCSWWYGGEVVDTWWGLTLGEAARSRQKHMQTCDGLGRGRLSSYMQKLRMTSLSGSTG